MSARPFASPVSARMNVSLRAGVGALGALGLAHAEAEWTPRLSLYAVGREGLAAGLPYALWAIALAACVAVTLGRAARAAALIACASLAALHALAPQLYHNNYYVLWLLLAITALEGTDARTPWAARDGARGTTALVRDLVRGQLALIYWLSVIAKLAHPWWRDGGAVVRWIVLERVPQSGVRGLVNPLLAPLLSAPTMAAAAQSTILCVEALLPLMLWSRRWRGAGFVVGALMHTVMQEWLFPQLFTFLMLLGYYAFAPVEDRAWTLSLDPTRRGHARLARALPRVDWLGRVALARRPTEALSLRAPDGRRWTGAAALWRLAVLTPLGVIAWAALSLIAPRQTELLGVPRAMIENLVVIAVGVVGLIPGKASSQSPPPTAGDGRETSHPVSAGPPP